MIRIIRYVPQSYALFPNEASPRYSKKTKSLSEDRRLASESDELLLPRQALWLQTPRLDWLIEMLLARYRAISTWEIRDIHVENRNSPRGRGMKLRRNQMKLRRKSFSPTWRIKNIHVKICDSSRGESVASVCNESINAKGDDQHVWPSPLALMGDVVSV